MIHPKATQRPRPLSNEQVPPVPAAAMAVNKLLTGLMHLHYAT